MYPRKFSLCMAVGVFSFGVAAGCATQGDVPTQDMTMARTLIEQADKSNAQQYAPADLQRAHDELSSAEKAINDHKYIEARRYAQNAQADADLATARGSSGEAQRAAHEVNRSIESLRQESDRHSNEPSGNQ